MWPYLIGIGAFIAALGVQEALKEHREAQKALLPPAEPRKVLPPPENMSSEAMQVTDEVSLTDLSPEMMEVLER